FCPPDHPFVATTLQNVGDCLHTLNRDLDRAESLLRDSLAMSKRLYGDVHPSIAITQQELANLLRDRGRLDEAEALAREAYQAHRAHHDWDPDDASRVTRSLLATLEAEQAWDRAAAVARDIVTDARTRVAPGDPYLAGTLAQLGRYLVLAGTAE